MEAQTFNRQSFAGYEAVVLEYPDGTYGVPYEGTGSVHCYDSAPAALVVAYGDVRSQIRQEIEERVEVVVATDGEVFEPLDFVKLVELTYRRFGRDCEAGRQALARMLQSSPLTTGDFGRLVRLGAAYSLVTDYIDAWMQGSQRGRSAAPVHGG